MRPWILAGAAFLVCGFSVFGRPSSTRRQIGDMFQGAPSLNWPLTPYTLASASSSSTADGDTSVPPQVQPDVPTSLIGSDGNAHTSLITDASHVLLTPGTEPNVQTTPIDFGGIPFPKLATAITPNPGTYDTTTFSAGDTSATSPPPEIAETAFAFSDPELLRARFQELHRRVSSYCLFELSDNRNDIVPIEPCGDPQDTFGEFIKDFDQHKPGFALWSKRQDEVYSFMNVHNDCQIPNTNPSWNINGRDTGTGGCVEGDLFSIKSKWIDLIHLEVATVTSFDSIRTDQELQAICKAHLVGFTFRSPEEHFRVCID